MGSGQGQGKQLEGPRQVAENIVGLNVEKTLPRLPHHPFGKVFQQTQPHLSPHGMYGGQSNGNDHSSEGFPWPAHTTVHFTEQPRIKPLPSSSLIEYLPNVRYYAKYFTCVFSFNPLCTIIFI